MARHSANRSWEVFEIRRMSTPGPSAVVLVIGPAAAPDLRDALATAGIDVIERAPDAVPDGLSGYATAILDARPDPETALAVCRRLALRPAEDRCPLLLLSVDDTLGARMAGYGAGA